MWCCKHTLTFPVRFSQHGDGRGARTDPYLSRQVLTAWRWTLCCKQTLTFPVRFSQHGDGRGAVNRPLPFPSGSPSMEMDVVLLTDPYLSHQVRPAWRWTWCCKQALTFPIRFAHHGDGCGAVNRPLPFPSGSPSMEMDAVL